MPKQPGGPYMGAAEVAAMFGVQRKATTRWAADGTLPASFRTPGGHRRWLRTDAEALKARLEAEAAAGRSPGVSYGDI